MALHHNAVLLVFSNTSTSVYSLSELLEIIFMKLNIFWVERLLVAIWQKTVVHGRIVGDVYRSAELQCVW
jgi:hypothetical protein